MSTNEATSNYQKLTVPKIYSQATYVAGWIKEVTSSKLKAEELKKKSTNPTKYPKFQAVIGKFSSYFEVMTINLIEQPNQEQKVYSGEYRERSKKWSKLNLPIKEIEKRFVELSQARISLSKENGYPSFLDMLLNQNNISKPDYEKFLKNVDETIQYCNQNLPQDNDLPKWFYSKFNFLCFICRLKNFPFKSLNQVFNFVAKEHPIIGKYKDKIKINLVEEGPSNIVYKKETDILQISIDKSNNLRHQSISLIHELSHAVALLSNAKNNISWMERGRFLDEKEAYEIEITLLKKISQDLYQANLADVLLTLRKVIFEIELYKNPKQNLSRLYTQTFNQCFSNGKQKENPLYILDHSITMNPLCNLPHAVAIVSVINI